MRRGLVPEVGLEPTCPCERQILSLVRIPISPLRQRDEGKDNKSNALRIATTAGCPISDSADAWTELPQTDLLPERFCLVPPAPASCSLVLSCEIRG
jgi:hypothetical protein